MKNTDVNAIQAHAIIPQGIENLPIWYGPFSKVPLAIVILSHIGIKYEMFAAIVFTETIVSNATSLNRYGIPIIAANIMLNQTAFAGTFELVSLVSHFENGIAPSRANAYVWREDPIITDAPLWIKSLVYYDIFKRRGYLRKIHGNEDNDEKPHCPRNPCAV